METHLRLAERQGLLQGRDLSPLQAYALVLLRWLDAREKRQALTDSVKQAVLASGAASIKDLYPEWFPEEVEEEEAEEGTAYDYSEVEWKTGTEAMSEYQRLMAEVNRNSKVTITPEQTSGGEWI